MTAKILQLVNSAFFGLQRSIATPTEAVRILGLATIKTLILSVHIFTHCDMAMLRALSLHMLWQHSLVIAACAKCIIEAEGGDHSMADEAFTAGLLHDVGKLVLAINLPQLYSAACTRAQEQSLPDWEGERVTYGATHPEVGAYLLRLWGLPDTLVEALAYHHRPRACPTRALSPLMAVHVANALGDENEAPKHMDSVDRRYLEELGLDDRLAHWHKQCQPLLEQAIDI
jgi:HD-like signal output (HDOD) protein